MRSRSQLRIQWTQALVVLFLVPGAAAWGQDTLEQGNLHGAIELDQVSAPVANYLQGNLVAPDSGGSIGCFHSGEFSAAVTGSYVESNTTPSPTSYRLAGYEVDPVVEAAGTAFLLEASSIRFADGATYRHGTRQGSSPAANLCPAVLPASANPSGTLCDASECAALITVRLRLSGATEDLIALSDPAGCGVVVQVEDTPGSAAFSPQAISAPRVAPLATLSDVGIEIPVLVRSQSRMQIVVGCEAGIVSGEEGFTIDPTTGMALFSPEQALFVDEIPCGEQASVDIDVPVDRPAGSVRGMFDIAGYDELSALVFVPGAPFNTAPPLFPAGSSPARNDAASYWSLEGLHEGLYELIATAIVDNGNTLVRLPTTTGANGPTAVTVGGTTDLDAFFISAPQALQGHVELIDFGATALHELQLEPLANFSTSPNANATTSRTEAGGDPDLVPNTGGASGIGGYTSGRLLGSYDADSGRGAFDYRLLLTGPSPSNAAVDGSEARPTAWDFRRFVFRLGGGDEQNVQSVRVAPGVDLHYAYEPNGPTLYIPPLTYCFGQLAVEMRIDAANGTLWSPSLELSGSVAANAETVVPNPNYSVQANVLGVPGQSANAAPQALAYATLPEGIQYSISPRVAFQPASGNSQELTLPALTLPQGGPLGCGDLGRACLFLSGAEGEATPLSVALDPGLPACAPSGAGLAVGIEVDSGGAPVDFVTVSLDGSPPQPHCAPCTSPISDYALPDVAPGPHTLAVTAGSVNGCTAEVVETFEVSPEPCVEVVGESREQLAYIDGDDLKVVRLEDNQVHFVIPDLDRPSRLIYDPQGERLAVVRNGGVLVVDADAPSDFAVFPGSYRSVAFRPTDNRDIALVETQPNGMYRVKVQMQAAGATVQTQDLGLPAGWLVDAPEIAWSPDGTRLLALVHGTTVNTSPTERRIILLEWNVAPTGLTLVQDPPWNWSTRIAKVFRVGYLASSTRAMLTPSGVFTVGDDAILREAIPRGMQLAEFPNPVVPAAAFAATDDASLGVAAELIANGPPSNEKPGGVAISAQLRLAAVVRADSGRVVLYRIEFANGQLALVPDREFTGAARGGIAFRPLAD